MQIALKNYHDLVKQLQTNRELVAKLEVKIEGFKNKVKELSEKKISHKDRIKKAFKDNVQGIISDEQLDGYNAEEKTLDRDWKNAEEKKAAAISILDETRKEEDIIDKQCGVALGKLKVAAYEDALARINDSDREKISYAMTLANHIPGTGAERVFKTAFPSESVEKMKTRWDAFIKKYQIPD